MNELSILKSKMSTYGMNLLEYYFGEFVSHCIVDPVMDKEDAVEKLNSADRIEMAKLLLNQINEKYADGYKITSEICNCMEHPENALAIWIDERIPRVYKRNVCGKGRPSQTFLSTNEDGTLEYGLVCHYPDNYEKVVSPTNNSNFEYGGIACENPLNKAMPFGQYKGRPLKDVYLENPGYLKWIASGRFAAPLKQCVQDVLDIVAEEGESALFY